MRGLDVGLSHATYRVWRDVADQLGVDWRALTTHLDDPRSIWAWRQEVVVERFHPSILRRLAERALEAGHPHGSGAAWVAAGGNEGHWLELEDLLRTLRAHREIEEVALLARPPRGPSGR